MKPTILHISSDYPDPLRPDKTKAILNLVEGTPEFRHVVYSLNRVNGWSGVADISFGEDRTAISYSAMPKGLFWERQLEHVARWIAADLKKKKIIPDAVEAHKLTVEGHIGLYLAKEFSCPLVCDIQGGTDLRVLKIKRSMHNRYREISDFSKIFFPYAPWVIDHFSNSIGLDKSKCICLPVLPGFDSLKGADVAENKRLVTLIRFHDRKNKNIAGLIGAMDRLSVKYPSLSLDIYGGGSAVALLQLKRMINKSRMNGRITLKGPVANEKLPEVLGRYSALVLPSFTETYGLVYAEALFCGVPVMFSRGRAIDGYFDSRSIGYACDPGSVVDIAAGLDYMLENEKSLKEGIREMQIDGGLNVIRRGNILSAYRQGLNSVLSGT